MNNEQRDIMIREIHGRTEILNDLKKAVFGNGQPGLLKEFQILKTEHNICNNSRAVRYSFYIALLTGPITAVITYWLMK